MLNTGGSTGGGHSIADTHNNSADLLGRSWPVWLLKSSVFSLKFTWTHWLWNISQWHPPCQMDPLSSLFCLEQCNTQFTTLCWEHLNYWWTNNTSNCTFGGSPNVRKTLHSLLHRESFIPQQFLWPLVLQTFQCGRTGYSSNCFCPQRWACWVIYHLKLHRKSDVKPGSWRKSSEQTSPDKQFLRY